MRLLKVSSLALLLSMAGLTSSHAQVPSGQPVYPVSRTFAALTLTAQGPATVNSNDIATAGFNAILCFYNQSAHTGTVSGVTVAIFNKDVTSGNYATTSSLTSASSTTDALQAAIQVGAGLPVTANVSANAVLSNVVRVQLVETGAGSTITGTVGCVLR